MLIGRDSTGKAQEIRTNENGNLEVVVSGGSGTSSETTLNASVQTVGTTATTINVNKKVTSIDIANYSESANITVGVGDSSYVIGSTVATTLAINKDVTTISLTSTEADTKVQIVVKVEEESQDGGGDDSGDDEETLTPVTENLSFDNLAMPRNMNIVLEKNILDYFSTADKADIESQVETDGYAYYCFYEYVDIPHVDYEQEEEPELPENRIGNLSLNFEISEGGVYSVNINGNFARTGDIAEFYIKFASLDGINFFVSSFSVLYYNDGAEYTVIPEKMEFPVTINFGEVVSESEDAKGWNDLLSEFLFTDEN